jgi:carboxymethylenebutenolidase
VGPRLHAPLRQGRLLRRRPELFKREGGVGHLPNVQDIVKIVFAVPRKQVLGDVAAAVDWAKKRPGARADRVGVTGWCWGGSVVYQVAATNPGHQGRRRVVRPARAALPDTPNPVTGFDVAKDIKMPFLGLYGETDQNPKPEDVKKLEEMVKQVNKSAEFVIYPGAGHGFFADYRPSYNAAAAADAWKRCTGCFDKALKA